MSKSITPIILSLALMFGFSLCASAVVQTATPKSPYASAQSAKDADKKTTDEDSDDSDDDAEKTASDDSDTAATKTAARTANPSM